MTKINVYLAKSNRADPTMVSRVRTYLKNHLNILNLREFTGGQYTNSDLLACNYVVFILEPKTNVLGKGLYQQIQDCKINHIPFTIMYTGENVFCIDNNKNYHLTLLEEDSFVNYAAIHFNVSSKFATTDSALVNHIGRFICDIVSELELQPTVRITKKKQVIPVDDFNIPSKYLPLLCR